MQQEKYMNYKKKALEANERNIFRQKRKEKGKGGKVNEERGVADEEINVKE